MRPGPPKCDFTPFGLNMLKFFVLNGLLKVTNIQHPKPAKGCSIFENFMDCNEKNEKRVFSCLFFLLAWPDHPPWDPSPGQPRMGPKGRPGAKAQMGSGSEGASLDCSVVAVWRTDDTQGGCSARGAGVGSHQ